MKKVISRIIVIILISGILFQSASCNKKKDKITANSQSAAAPPLKVEAHIVSTSPLTEKLELPGTLIANEATEIHPEISGRLTYLNVTEGKKVSKGTLIGKIYDGDLVAQLNKLKAQLGVAEQTSRRYAELLKINGVSQQEYDMNVLSTNNIRADIEIVRSNILRTEIHAPFSGTLGLKMVSPGAYVTPQTVITSIRQTDELKLDYTLPEKYSSRVKIGQLLELTVEGNPKIYHAKIAATESGVTEESRSLRVRALVIDNDEKLLPGVFVKVITRFDPNPNAIMIPSQAVLPQAKGKKVAVYHSGSISFEDVTTGLRDTSSIQVMNGLKPGDTIILTGLMSLKPGSKVQISKIEN